MRKIYSRIAVPLALTLMVASAFAAPKPQNLTTALISEGEWAAVGVHDFDTFWNKPDDSLLKNWIEIAGSGERLPVSEKMVASDLRLALEDEDVIGVALAIQITDDVSYEEILTAGPADVADFTVPEVEGAVVTPLAVIRPRPDDESSAGDIYLAQLDRDGVKFLIATSGSPEDLAVMASAPEDDDAAVPSHVTTNLWFMLNKAVDTDSLGELDFVGEFGLDDTRTSVKLYSWVNVSGQAPSADGAVLNVSKVLENGSKPVEPNLFGKSPLYALINLSASFLNPELTVEDLVTNEEDMAKAQMRLGQLRELTGLEWSDVLSTLRGNITLGISGNARAMLVGSVPGAYLNLSGMPADASERLISMAKTLVSSIITPEEFDDGKLKGIRIGAPVSAVVASGNTGLTAALMLPEDIAVSPKTDLTIAPAVNTAHNITIAFNIKELRPVLRDIYSRWGSEILSYLGGDEDAAEAIDIILASLSLIDGISIVNEKEITVTEITPNADIMSLVILANKIL